MTALVPRALASRALPAVTALCAVALASPSLRTGWILDDIWHRAGHTRAEALRPYVDPGTEPVRFAAATLERLPILTLGLFGVPADIYMLLSASAARLYATGAILALVVLCAGMPGGRNLGFAALGMAGLVACLTERAARAPSLALSGVLARRLALAALTAILLLE